MFHRFGLWLFHTFDGQRTARPILAQLDFQIIAFSSIVDSVDCSNIEMISLILPVSMFLHSLFK